MDERWSEPKLQSRTSPQARGRKLNFQLLARTIYSPHLSCSSRDAPACFRQLCSNNIHINRGEPFSSVQAHSVHLDKHSRVIQKTQYRAFRLLTGTTMESLTARLASFEPPTSSRSRTKPPRAIWPWPKDSHPRLHPQRMADAGFFFDPTDEVDDDTCRCFCCGSRLGGWDVEADDPLEEHSRKDCAWAEMYCVPRLAVEKDDVR